MAVAISIAVTIVIVLAVVFSGKYFSMVEKSLDAGIKQSEENKEHDEKKTKS